jgi:hypothetical protein
MPVTDLALQGPRLSWPYCSDLIAMVTLGRSCACSRSEQYGMAANRSRAWRPLFRRRRRFRNRKNAFRSRSSTRNHVGGDTTPESATITSGPWRRKQVPVCVRRFVSSFNRFSYTQKTIIPRLHAIERSIRPNKRSSRPMKRTLHVSFRECTEYSARWRLVLSARRKRQLEVAQPALGNTRNSWPHGAVARLADSMNVDCQSHSPRVGTCGPRTVADWQPESNPEKSYFGSHVRRGVDARCKPSCS